MASGNDNWNTPPELFEPALRMVERFDLDPFPNPTSIVPCTYQAVDGFSGDWDHHDAWVNGPWSRQSDVVAKCVEQAMHGVEILLVQPASINSSYWQHIERAPARCRPFRRVAFLRDGKPVKGNRTDIVLVYWGPRVWQFKECYRRLGEVDR